MTRMILTALALTLAAATTPALAKETPTAQQVKSDTYASRVKTSDKHQRAVLDFIKG